MQQAIDHHGWFLLTGREEAQARRLIGLLDAGY
jgi:hypothetical protein